jgi:hypothetical protein
MRRQLVLPPRRRAGGLARAGVGARNHVRSGHVPVRNNGRGRVNCGLLDSYLLISVALFLFVNSSPFLFVNSSPFLFVNSSPFLFVNNVLSYLLIVPLSYLLIVPLSYLLIMSLSYLLINVGP